MRITNSGHFGDTKGVRGKGSLEEGVFELGFQRGGRVQQVEDGPTQRKHKQNSNETLKYASNRDQFTKQFQPDLCNSNVFMPSRRCPFLYGLLRCCKDNIC